MPRRRRRRAASCLLSAALLLLCSGPPAGAQQQEPRQDLLKNGNPNPFPQATGANGFEEIVAAIDALWENPALRDARTLADKRRALADPDCARALRLLRQGLAKPCVRPPTSSDSTRRFNGGFVYVTDLEGLLRIEQYVLCADGRAEAALDSLRDSLRLAWLLQRYPGYRFAHYMEQLSARDCDTLLRLVRAFLAAPDPAIVVFERQREEVLETVARLRREGDLSFWEDEVGRSVSFGFLSAETAGAFREDFERLRRDPAARDAFASELSVRVNRLVDGQIEQVRFPQRTPLPPAPPALQTPADRFARMLLGFQDGLPAGFTANRTELQLFGVHAAIRRFRWEQDRLPEGLEELRLGDLATDPFTGKGLLYRRTGPITYALSSVGPPKRDALRNIVPDQRVPVTVSISPEEQR